MPNTPSSHLCTCECADQCSIDELCANVLSKSCLRGELPIPCDCACNCQEIEFHRLCLTTKQEHLTLGRTCIRTKTTADQSGLFAAECMGQHTVDPVSILCKWLLPCVLDVHEKQDVHKLTGLPYIVCCCATTCKVHHRRVTCTACTCS